MKVRAVYCSMIKLVMQYRCLTIYGCLIRNTSAVKDYSQSNPDRLIGLHIPHADSDITDLFSFSAVTMVSVTKYA